MHDEPVAYEARDGVAWITLNRPAVLNALDTELAAALADHVEAAAAAGDVALVIVRGRGRAFCSGMDRTALGERRRGPRHRPGELGVPGGRDRADAPGAHRQGARRVAHGGRPHQAAPPGLLSRGPARPDRGTHQGAERVHGLVGDRGSEPGVAGEAGGGFLPATGPAPGAVSDVILQTEGLTKEFLGFVAVKGVSLHVRRGTLHALIGPNGAGETTCLNP